MTTTPLGEWVVEHQGQRIAAAFTPATARSLRDRYLHCTPSAHPAQVFVTARTV